MEKFDKFKTVNTKFFKKQTKLPLDLLSTVDVDIPQIETNVNYWLKPIGDKDNPVTESWSFNGQYQNLDFSKRRPTGIHKNDIVITYGVGCGMILSVFKVTSEEPHYATDKEKMDDGWKNRWRGR